jgi:hypothetical protein
LKIIFLYNLKIKIFLLSGLIPFQFGSLNKDEEKKLYNKIIFFGDFDHSSFA